MKLYHFPTLSILCSSEASYQVYPTLDGAGVGWGRKGGEAKIHLLEVANTYINFLGLSVWACNLFIFIQSFRYSSMDPWVFILYLKLSSNIPYLLYF